MTSPDRCALLLDIDGTLIDSTYHHALAWHRSFRRHDIEVPLWQVHRAIGMGGDKLVAHVTDDAVEDAHGDDLRDAWKEEYTAVLDEVLVLPGAAEVVHAAAAAGHPVALASSGEEEFAKVAIDRLGIEADVAVLTTVADAEQSKPEPDLLGATLQRLDVDLALLVGDTPYDVRAAERIGLACVGVLTGGFSREELTGAGAVHVVESLTELVGADWTSWGRPPADV